MQSTTDRSNGCLYSIALGLDLGPHTLHNMTGAKGGLPAEDQLAGPMLALHLTAWRPESSRESRWRPILERQHLMADSWRKLYSTRALND